MGRGRGRGKLTGWEGIKATGVGGMGREGRG